MKSDLSARRRLRRSHGDGGITVVFFAIALSGILGVSALVLGGSVGYEAARNAQTAADAGALAGASALQNHKQQWLTMPADDVLKEIEAVVADNGASFLSCDLVNAGYALSGAESDVLEPCSELAKLPDEDFQQVAGVRVKVSDSRGVALSAFIGQDEITANAVAAATIQPVTGGKAPFMVCSNELAVGHPARALSPSETDPSGWAINQAAVGKYFVLWGNHMKEKGRDCGLGSSDWRGLLKFGTTYTLNSWWGVESGNTNGNTAVTLDAAVMSNEACALHNEPLSALSSQIGCELALPICTHGNTSTSTFELYCVKMAMFRISHVGSAWGTYTMPPDAASPCGLTTSNIICGEFVGAAPAVEGQGVADAPDRHEVSVIRLVQ